MNERFHRYKFKMNIDSSRKPEMVIFPNDENVLIYKMLDKNNQEIEATLFETEVFYERENKPDKVLYSQPVSENQFITNIDAELARYDVVLVVDTSYELISTTKIAFTSIMLYYWLLVDDGECEHQCSSNLIEWDATSINKPENFMYAFAIEFVRDHFQELNENPIIAVIIDSELGDIPSYNDRTKPIFNNYFLPEGYYIFYASDKGGYLQNKLLKKCDKKAKKALEQYKKNTPSHIV